MIFAIFRLSSKHDVEGILERPLKLLSGEPTIGQEGKYRVNSVGNCAVFFVGQGYEDCTACWNHCALFIIVSHKITKAIADRFVLLASLVCGSHRLSPESPLFLLPLGS